MHNLSFVNKANFVKVYNNFVLKWLIALYVVVVPEQILLGSIWRTLKGFVMSVQWVYRDCQILPGVRMTKHSSIINTDSFYTLINTSSNVK
jgi:hypothetical protein